MYTSLPTVLDKERERDLQYNWRRNVREHWYNADPNEPHPNSFGAACVSAADYFIDGNNKGPCSAGWNVTLLRPSTEPGVWLELSRDEVRDYFYEWATSSMQAGWLTQHEDGTYTAYFPVDNDWYQCTLTPIGQYDGDGVYLIKQFAIDPNFTPPERGPIAWADTTLLHCSHGWETVHV